jgi:hypothetical protein
MSNFPTLDGLNNISGDSADLTNITCNTFIATTSAQAPTMTTGDISDHIATTAFVDDAITNAPFVTLNTTQTLTTGTKFFTNLPECATLATTGNQFTNKTYVDNAVSGLGGSAVLLAGNQTLTTGVKTFTNLPESSATPTTANQLIPKTYVDTNFVNLTGTQTITGNKTFTGNNIFDCSTGTNSIKGNQVDIFPTITYLTSPTTSVSGTNFNMNSTTNYISGTITYLASPTIVVNSTCNSFYVDASYSNFVGDNTLLQSPYTAITNLVTSFVNDSLSTIINSPYMAITSACTSLNLNATNTTITGNTNMTGSVVTATTQASSDNSTKVATTAFVNAHVSSLYMSLATNQNVSGVKTYSTKQIFNAGTACSTYDNTSLTDMSLAGNSGNGILTIAGGRIVCDTFGVSIAETLNLQLNEGTFIQPNVSLSPIDEPVFTFGLNQLADYILIPPANTQYDATKKINTGIFSWFAGNNQSTTFTITHSIINNRISGWPTYQELEVYFYFQDMNTGIIRYQTGNLADTTAFTMLPSSTYVRPTITFTLTTATLPQGAYSIYAYSRASGINVAGTQQVNWNLSSPVSSFSTLQDYNTYKDYTFTSRNLYHCFRNYVAGVYIINNIAVAQNIMLPIFYSVTDLTNIMSQPTTSGAVPTTDGGAFSGETGVGNYNVLGCDNKDNYWLVYPNYGLKVYNSAGWGGTVYLNYRNKTNNPVVVAGTTIQGATSVKVYFDSVELIKY